MINTVAGSITQDKPFDMAETHGLMIMLLILLEKSLLTTSKGIVIYLFYNSKNDNVF